MINWITGNMGVEGDYSYGVMHLTSTAIVVLLTVGVMVLGYSKLDDRKKRGILKGICIFQLTFEVLWRVLFVVFKGTEAAYLWPMYPCNLGGVLIPIIGLMNHKRLKSMFYLFGFVGAVLTFAIPNGIYSNSVFIFPIFKSILQHTGLLLIPAFEYASGTFRPSVRTYPWLIVGCLIHAFNCEVIDRWFGLTEDYMFFRSDMPFVIPGVPQFITLSVFAIIVFFLLSVILNIPEAKKLWEKKKEK